MRSMEPIYMEWNRDAWTRLPLVSQTVFLFIVAFLWVMLLFVTVIHDLEIEG